MLTQQASGEFPLTILIIAAISAVVFGFIGWMIGKQKGRGAEGLGLGIILSVFGVIIIAVMDDKNAIIARNEAAVDWQTCCGQLLKANLRPS